MKYVTMFCILFLMGCIVVLPPKEKVEEPKDCVNPEGPWYSPQFLEENPHYRSDMYLCSNYYRLKEKHTVPIVCGPEEDQCGIKECECVCHK